MFKKILKFALVLFLFVLAERAFAVGGTSLILPPQTRVLKSQPVAADFVEFFNELEKTRSYTLDVGTKVIVPLESKGVRIYTPDFFIYANTEAEITYQDNFSLGKGSAWVKSNNSEIAKVILASSLRIEFNYAEFLLFVAGDGSEVVVKVLDGQVKVVNTLNTQFAELEKGQFTSLNGEENLAAPSLFEEETINFWWETEEYKSKVSSPPVAKAGEDQKVLEGVLVVFDGSESTYAGGDIFEWTLESGPVTELAYDTSDIVRPKFTPPEPGIYRFSLVITSAEGEKSDSDEIAIYVGENYLEPEENFSDVPKDYPYNIAINYLYETGVIKGYLEEEGDLVFKPEQEVNRVEILKIILLGSKIEVTELAEGAETIFPDVNPQEWYAKYVHRAKDLEIISGNPDGNYRPADGVNKVEALKIILKTNNVGLGKYEDVEEIPFADTPLGSWYLPYITFAKEFDLVEADEDNNIYPGENLTRGEIAEIIYRLIKSNQVNTKGTLKVKVIDKLSKVGVSGAEVYIYNTEENEGSSENGESQIVIKRKELFKIVKTNNQGEIEVVLPVDKYNLQAFSPDEEIVGKEVIIEIRAGKSSSIIFEIGN